MASPGAASSQRTLSPAEVRAVVRASLDAHATLTLADLADEVSVRAAGAPLDRVPATRVCDVYHALCSVHVPALVAEGRVAYDEDRDLVSRRGVGADAPSVPVTRRANSATSGTD